MWHNSDGKGHLTRSTKSMLRDKPRFEVAHILQKHHHQIPELTTNSWQARTLYAIEACRTSVLGGAWSVIRDFADNPVFLGAKTGMIAVLHTWGQNLSLHPHLHCIVPGGGITPTKSPSATIESLISLAKM